MQSNDDSSDDGKGGESELKNWFERQYDTIKRLGELQQRIEHPDGRPTESLLAEMEALANEVKTQDAPSLSRPQSEAEKAKRREAMSDIRSGFLAHFKATFEGMNQPSPLDLSGAICEGDLAEVRRLLDAGVNPNAPTSTRGDTMLKTAYLFGHREIAALLRERGAAYGIMEAAIAGDANAVARLLDADQGQSTMDQQVSRALKSAVYKGHDNVVRLLLSRGADPNRPDKNGHSPLASACMEGFPEIARLLVEAGARVGIVEAAYLGDIPLIAQLLDEGVDIESVNAAHATPLIAASDCGHVEAARLLLERGARPDRESETERAPLRAAVARERVPVIHLLLDYGADPNAVCSRFGSTPLSSAVTFGKLRSIEALLARGANPNKATRDNKTPLHHCARCLVSFLRKQPDVMVRIASLLLDAGANIEARDEREFTPLMCAAKSGDGELVRLLLAHGASLTVSDTSGYSTPLSCARSTDGPKDRRDKTEVRRLIMEAMGPKYAVYDAAERGDINRLATLLNTGAPADEGIVFDERMLDSGILKKEDFASTPLTAAAENGHAAVVSLLLLQKNISTHSKNRALFAAEYKQHEEAARLLREAGAVNLRDAHTQA